MKLNTQYPLNVIALATLMLSACAVRQPAVPVSLEFPRSGDQRNNSTLGAANSANGNTIIRERLPVPPAFIEGNLRSPTATTQAKESGADGKADISVTIEQMPLPSFIQAVYGGILQLNHSMDSAVQARTELITFRSPRPMTAKKLMEVSESLLKSYGVGVQDLSGVIRFVPSTATAGVAPLVRRGRAQPGVPLPLRPIFHFIETDAITVSAASQSLKTVLGDKISIASGPTGGLMLSGQPDDVNIALELLQVFDQPALRAYQSVRVIPRYWGADEFARRLNEVLRVEGYSVGSQAGTGEPIVVLAIAPINSVLIFANSREVLNHALEWTRELDQISNVQAGSAYFTYAVRNADAQELAKALNDVITSTPATSNTAVPASNAAVGATAVRASRRVVVNNATNSLIFQGGSQEDYRQWLTLLADLDRPAKSALVDVLVAEVALSDASDLGFNWKLDQLGSGAQAVRLSGTTYNQQIGGAGLGISALLGGNPLRQLAISALASNKDSRVVSNPRIMMRNGESASINVGQDVPVITSQAIATSSTSNTQAGSVATTTVPQSVQYRSTGVILKVRPVIHAGDRIDLEVSQEISSAEPTTTGVSTSPTIRKRSLETKLTVKDGSTILLGGLISESSSGSDSGVPGIKDAPILGGLFKSQQKSRDRTELVMLITPYVINDQAEAEGATDAFNASLGTWAQDIRERIRVRRANNAASSATYIQPLDIGQKPIALPVPASVPTSPSNNPSGNGSSSSPQNISSQPDSSDAAQTRPISRGMINSTNVNPDAASVSAPAAGNSNAPANNSKASTSAPAPTATPAARVPAPAMIGGIKTPEGATVVTDPKLIEEIMRSLKK